ncbi:MAG: DUF5682 family protein [Bacteroidota bacterium]
MRKIFGIRHHGPGSAERLAVALDEMQPDIVLIEGPPEANGVLPLAVDPDMKPPVALLIYSPKALQHASYYPFAAFSPEWQAIRHALTSGIPVRFIDLSPAVRWKQMETREKPNPKHRPDPLEMIARLAGATDGESWWDEQIEGRKETDDLFDSLIDLFGAIREDAAMADHIDEQTLRREAHMRREIRKAEKEGYERMAVVCGAFHAPVLHHMPTAKSDNALLKGLRKSTAKATWIPWTYDRLAFRSGYGAGIHSPAWYDTLFSYPAEELVEQWMIKTAQLFRQNQLDASPAHVIEAVRLTHALTALRGRQQPGLLELMEAIETIFCFGDPAPLQLVEQHLVVGKQMGQVPDEVPSLPLQQDVARLQKSLRLKPAAGEVSLDLDIRKEYDLRKSRFLHQMKLLGIQWGEVIQTKNNEGTFREEWKLVWQPEANIQIIEAASWGNTVEAAARQRVYQALEHQMTIPELSRLLSKLFLAGLDELIPRLARKIADAVALSADVSPLLTSMPELVQLLRYGDVRNTGHDAVAEVLRGLLPRLMLALPDACRNLDQAFAEKRFAQVQEAHRAMRLLQDQAADWPLNEWAACLQKIVRLSAVHPKIAGGACRILFDQESLDTKHAAQLMQQVLSPGTEASDASAWIEGFLYGSGLLLIHHPELFHLLDEWITHLPESRFTESLPLMRRTFAAFSTAERRQLGQLAKGQQQSLQEKELSIHPERAAALYPVLRQILGQHDASSL